MSWRRRIAMGLVLLLAFSLIAGVVLWWLKPWVPDVVLSAPGDTGERITEPGVFANYFPADAKRGPGVLLLGGSEGGIGKDVTRRAVDLQSQGFSVLSPSYFRAPGQPESLELVPLETFDRALDWLRGRPEVDPQRMAVVGHSKGAEAALLVGVRHPELRAVIAAAPSSVVWDGIDWSVPINPDSSWEADGEALPSLPYAFFRPWRPIVRGYEDGLEHLDEHRDAAIQVERIQAPVLLVCGEADTLWPSCDMSRRLRARAAQEDGPRVTLLAYPRAGHVLFGPRLPDDDPDLSDPWSGGTAEANNEARTKSWSRVIDFLRGSLT